MIFRLRPLHAGVFPMGQGACPPISEKNCLNIGNITKFNRNFEISPPEGFCPPKKIFWDDPCLHESAEEVSVLYS